MSAIGGCSSTIWIRSRSHIHCRRARKSKQKEATVVWQLIVCSAAGKGPLLIETSVRRMQDERLGSVT